MIRGVMLLILSQNKGLSLALAGFEKSLADSSGHGVR